MGDLTTLKEVIDFAMEKEAEAEGLYENLSRQVKTDRAKKIFLELAAEEHKHYVTLSGVNLGKIPEFKISEVSDLKISDYLKDVPISTDMSFQDILLFAMKSEEHSHSLYQGLARHSGDEELKRVFEFLAMQEARHKLRLETEYDDYILTQD